MAWNLPEPDGKRIAIVATLDTKGAEVAFVRDLFERSGKPSIVIDVSTRPVPTGELGFAIGDVLRPDHAEHDAVAGPAAALDAIAAGTKDLVERLQKDMRIGAVLGIAGGKGSALFKTVTENLPYGFPKVLVSSARPQLLASFAQTADVVLFPTLVDLFGVNGFTERVLRNAAHAVAAMEWHVPAARSKPVVGITAFGVTTPAVSRCVSLLSDAGIEPLAFPANGAGGRLLEKLVRAGEIDAVLDLTTTELADELVGGTASAGPDRLTAAGEREIPHLVVPGAVDMVNFGPRDQVPKSFDKRLFYQHTAQTTLMRTTIEENRRIGAFAGSQLARGRGPLLILFPSAGVSDYDRPGHPFLDLPADRAWLDGIAEMLPKRAELRLVDMHINDPAFAQAAVDWILSALQNTRKTADAQAPLPA